MEYAYATLLLNESNEEINETNLTAVLEASGCAIETSRIKALVAALEDVDLDGVVPADVGGGSEHERQNGHGDGETVKMADANAASQSATADTDSDSQSATTEADSASQSEMADTNVDRQNEETSEASEGQPGDDATAET